MSDESKIEELEKELDLWWDKTKALESMFEEKERSCISCCEKITEKYAEELEPFLKEYEELENGDRAQPTSDESNRGTS